MAGIILPYPDLEFAKGDVLKASSLNELQANIKALANSTLYATVTELDHFNETEAWFEHVWKNVNVKLPASGIYKFHAHAGFIGTSGKGEGAFGIMVDNSAGVNINKIECYNPGALTGGSWMGIVTAPSNLQLILRFYYSGNVTNNGRWGDTTYCFTRIA